MAAQLRVLRRRIRSVESTKKITRAQELIAASRIVKAQQRLQASIPYSRALIRALEAAASHSGLNHPLLTSSDSPKRSAVIVVTSDRGFAGAYSANVLRQAEALSGLLREQGQEVVPYVVGRKGVSWFRFRDREVGGEYTGFSENPTYADARAIADDVLAAMLRPTEEGGVDEIHEVFTFFHNMVRQEARARRLFPVVVVDQPEVLRRVEGRVGDQWPGQQEPPPEDEGAATPLYEFEPSPEDVLASLLPQYAGQLVYTALLLSAASEHSARRRAMKSATDNAEELVTTLSQQANAARQAEITQEISEIVGGANALAGAGSE